MDPNIFKFFLVLSKYDFLEEKWKILIIPLCSYGKFLFLIFDYFEFSREHIG